MKFDAGVDAVPCSSTTGGRDEWQPDRFTPVIPTAGNAAGAVMADPVGAVDPAGPVDPLGSVCPADAVASELVAVVDPAEDVVGGVAVDTGTALVVDSAVVGVDGVALDARVWLDAPESDGGAAAEELDPIALDVEEAAAGAELPPFEHPQSSAADTTAIAHHSDACRRTKLLLRNESVITMIGRRC